LHSDEGFAVFASPTDHLMIPAHAEECREDESHRRGARTEEDRAANADT
jgi:hypothetical protein